MKHTCLNWNTLCLLVSVMVWSFAGCIPLPWEAAGYIDVNEGQTIQAGQTKALAVTALNVFGEAITIDPDRIAWAATSGQQYISFKNGDATGIKHGEAMVVAMVDGMASPAVKVRVTPVKRAMLIPPIAGTPEDAINTGASISADGMVVVGESETASGQFHAYRWTEVQGTQDLGVLTGFDTSIAYRTNADGSVVVGTSYLASNAAATGQAFIWTASGGMKAIDGFPDGTIMSVAYGVSGDGNLVGGMFEINNPDDNPPMVGEYGFLWSKEGGLQVLGDFLPPDAPEHKCRIWAISADGDTIVGSAAFDIDEQEQLIAGPARWIRVGNVWDTTLLGEFPGANGEGEAYCVNGDGAVAGGWTKISDEWMNPFRWSLVSGMTFPLFKQILVMQACSHDGAVMAGSGGNPGNAFLWDVYRGTRNLYDVLHAEGLLDDLDGKSPSSVMGLSADGQAMVGDCGPGNNRAYLVELPLAP